MNQYTFSTKKEKIQKEFEEGPDDHMKISNISFSVQGEVQIAAKYSKNDKYNIIVEYMVN